ncbi:MAG: hypothetical protein ACXWKP_02990 [Bradyrhizobium sp.]|jgi:hypothetical protein
MECPFCAETVKDEATVCKHCSRDLRLVRPVILEVQQIVAELDDLRRELDWVNAKLDWIKHPVRTLVTYAIIYVLVPSIALVAAHIIVTIVLDVKPLYLRLASVIIPLPFGLAMYALHQVRFRGTIAVGFLTAALSILCMLTVTGFNDRVPIIPASWIEWREVIEYTMSIVLAFGTGNILGVLIFRIVPGIMAQGGRPNPAAYRLAKVLGQHVGDEQLRRRARVIQDLMRTIGPLAGIVVTASGSLYAGLKGIFGW